MTAFINTVSFRPGWGTRLTLKRRRTLDRAPDKRTEQHQSRGRDIPDANHAAFLAKHWQIFNICGSGGGKRVPGWAVRMEQPSRCREDWSCSGRFSSCRPTGHIRSSPSSTPPHPTLIHLGVWFILFEVKGLESCYKGIKRSPLSLPFKWEHGRDMRAF